MENIQEKPGQENVAVEEKVLQSSETKIEVKEFSIKELMGRYESYKSIVEVKKNELRDAESHLSGLKIELEKAYAALSVEVPVEFKAVEQPIKK